MANIRLQMYILHWMSVINDFPLYFRTKFPFQHLKNGQLHTHSDGVGAQWVKIGLWSCGIQFLKFGVCPAHPRKKNWILENRRLLVFYPKDKEWREMILTNFGVCPPLEKSCSCMVWPIGTHLTVAFWS